MYQFHFIAGDMLGHLEPVGDSKGMLCLIGSNNVLVAGYLYIIADTVKTNGPANLARYKTRVAYCSAVTTVA